MVSNGIESRNDGNIWTLNYLGIYNNILSHSTLTLWANFKLARTGVNNINAPLMKFNIENRF